MILRFQWSFYRRSWVADCRLRPNRVKSDVSMMKKQNEMIKKKTWKVNKLRLWQHKIIVGDALRPLTCLQYLNGEALMWCFDAKVLIFHCIIRENSVISHFKEIQCDSKWNSRWHKNKKIKLFTAYKSGCSPTHNRKTEGVKSSLK